MVEVPTPDSLWFFPQWTNPKWSGPWRVLKIAHHYGPNGAHPDSECMLPVVLMERVEGPPERGSSVHEVELSRWPAGWEEWPEVPDAPPFLL